MRYEIDPGKSVPTVNVIDNLIYSKEQIDKSTGQKMELRLSILMPGMPPREAMNPNAEVEGTILAELPKLPCIVWVPGGGWRGQDKNQMVCELGYLCRSGYVVACVQYRTSSEAIFPGQLCDLKAAIRFLRTKGSPYWIDPDRIGIMGRSAGGHLTSLIAENLPGYDNGEWEGVSDFVKCGVDLFGPTDMERCLQVTIDRMKQPDFRWKKIEESHEYVLIGSLEEKAVQEASPYCHVNPDMASLLIMHGSADPLVPIEISERFYEKVCKEGCGEACDFVVIKNAGHGTEEFWQEETQKVIVEYLDKYLK